VKDTLANCYQRDNSAPLSRVYAVSLFDDVGNLQSRLERVAALCWGGAYSAVGFNVCIQYVALICKTTSRVLSTSRRRRSPLKEKQAELKLAKITIELINTERAGLKLANITIKLINTEHHFMSQQKETTGDMQMSETFAQNTCISQEAHRILVGKNEKLKKDLWKSKAKVRALTEAMDKMKLINMEDTVNQQKQIIGDVQLPVAIPENTCTINEDKVSITEDSQKIEIEQLKKDLWTSRATIRALTEAMDRDMIQPGNDLNLELLAKNNLLTSENEGLKLNLKMYPSDQKMLNIYSDKTDKLKTDLWKWKQKARTLDLVNVCIQTKLSTAQVNHKDQLETIASLNETINRMPLDLKVADNTKLDLENTFLQNELHTAQVQNRDQLETTDKLKKDSCELKQQVETLTELIDENKIAYENDLELKQSENIRLQTELQIAQLHNTKQLETMAGLAQTVRKTLQELEGARLDLDKKTCTIEKQNIELEKITREKEAEENNKLQLEQEKTSLLQAIESLQQPEVSERPRRKKWYQRLFPCCGRQTTTD